MSKETLPVLIDAISEAYDNPEMRSANGKTHCDAAVGYIMAKFGVKKYLPDEWTANSIIDDLRKNPVFKTVNGSKDAQRLANKGSLVVAGIQEDPHGHLAVVRPGIAEWSNSWRRLAPKGMSIGNDAATFIGKKLSWAFKKEPEYFLLRETDDVG
jgi:hypothetical protein